MCRSLLCQLLVDQRGGRRGFPKDVTRDILALWSLYAELHPAAEDIASAPVSRRTAGFEATFDRRSSGVGSPLSAQRSA
jgi:hypothetical protein